MSAFQKAGEALADLHNKNISHGRPAIRDFCWRAPDVRLLDFERFSQNRRHARRHELIIFAHSALSTARGLTPELMAALNAYRSHNTTRTWEKAARHCARLNWLDWVTKPVQWRKPGKAKEFKAIPMVLDLFAGRAVTPSPIL